MLAWQSSGGVSVESIEAIQKSWDSTTKKSKQASVATRGTMTRADFNKLNFVERGQYLKSGVKLVD